MSVFSTFPRIRHLHGSSADHDDLVWSEAETREWLTRPVQVFEKMDGVNVTFACEGRGQVRFAIKPEWKNALGGRIERAIALWTLQHERQLLSVLETGAHLYGEWVWHRISVPYNALPAPLLGIAARDDTGRLLPFRDAVPLLVAAGIRPTSVLFEGRLRNRATLERLARKTNVGAAETEGIVVEAIDVDAAARNALNEEHIWAKWVRSDYAHPRASTLSGEKNALASVAVHALHPATAKKTTAKKTTAKKTTAKKATAKKATAKKATAKKTTAKKTTAKR